MCGNSAVFGIPNASQFVATGLHNNQHRAQDYAGIVSSDNGDFQLRHGVGRARKVFTAKALAELRGDCAIGHIRYPTVADNKRLVNIQPVIGRYDGKPIAVVHNGNIVNVEKLKKHIDPRKLLTSMDSEYIVRLLEALCTGNIEKDIETVFGLLEGSITICVLLPDRLIAVRDKSGNRPLSVARLNGGYCVSSETSAFSSLGATEYVDVEPGSLVSITRKGRRTIKFAYFIGKQCIFELIYFSLPTSEVFGLSVSMFRIKLGQALEMIAPVPSELDFVTAIPDSSNNMALGYASNGNSGKYYMLITRSHSHSVGRSFIASSQAERQAKVTQKFSFDAPQIRGKRIAVVDDSIVRGNTLPVVVDILHKLGAKEVHVRIGSPPIKYPCPYGIATPTEEELISSSHSPEEIRALVKADSLEFLPLDELKKLLPNPEKFCYACMDGEYWRQ